MKTKTDTILTFISGILLVAAITMMVLGLIYCGPTSCAAH